MFFDYGPNNIISYIKMLNICLIILQVLLNALELCNNKLMKKSDINQAYCIIIQKVIFWFELY